MKEIQLICILFVCSLSILGEFASGELVVKPSRKPRLNLSCDGNHGEVTMGLTVSDKTSCAECKQGHQCLDYGKTRVVVTEEDNCQLVDWTTTELTELKDCIDLVDDGVPLFFSMPDNDGDGRADQMCLSSRYESPFVAEASDSPLNLTYYLCYDDDVLKSMGYRVTVWVTPFINSDCESYDFADQNQYFVKDENGTTQRTSWWEGAVAGIVDFTNPDAVEWWTGRLTTLKEETGVDGFKFDAGETNWLPRIYTLGIDKKYWPNGYTPAYVGTVSAFGNFSEVRTGTRSQKNAIFVRMLDKSSVWTEDNGLRTMIPSLLHSGIIGYPFVLPDMIGGNAYGGRPNYNATAITKGVAELHAEYAPTIIDLANRAVQGEGPMMRPTWWLVQLKKIVFLAVNRMLILEFLLGDDILVTPVVYEAATTLDVVFPPGQWKQSDTGDVYEGVSKQTIENINIESNIYFTRV
ncbi:Alpha-xylosidase [Armadillidium nasatum]|uniref:Alpha-xylosidase n=1 Tax=Armadillidium nasatum TaxID=96803 RepID=A0A5N5T7Q1_9CRUS|nr:Alpha-xylosidase [Armadillidium nasatum]